MSSKAGPQGWLAQTCRKTLKDLDGCGPPGRSRREPARMEEGFCRCLVLGGSGGERALLIHC